jgi:hypothetical protein
MRPVNSLERYLRTNKGICPAKPDFTFADRAFGEPIRDRRMELAFPAIEKGVLLAGNSAGPPPLGKQWRTGRS